MDEAVKELNTLYAFSLLVALTISILCVRYTIRLRCYLEEFIYVSKKISNKEFHARLNIEAKGDLGQLSKNFNEMIDILGKTIEEVEYKHLQVESILKSISHGILAIDVNSNIMLINEEAKKMIKSNKEENIEGSNINNVIKEEKILKEILNFMVTKKNDGTQITISDDKVYNIKIDPIYLQDTDNVVIGSIVNIEDITEKVKLENMRSDFVANVSHELKTPLTSISGFVETLRLNENIEVSTRNRFLGIIESESNRLKRLIEDILLLSFIENKDNLLIQSVNLYEVFIEVYDMATYMAEAKNINISYKFSDEEINILSNRDYIKQVFLNLIDNAIKYTSENGEVRIEVEYKADIIIKVIDNGVGIPEEEIERIFERFYRVDKARSRDEGGTGLGLAITKHIVKCLDGTIQVKSKYKEGSEFIVTIPRKNFLD